MKKPNKQILNESQWYNTVLDVAGIFDPTGAIDLINAISYFKQGDTFFGILSLISVVPVAGDAVAKPLMGLGKSSKLFKYVDEALILAKTNPKAAEKMLLNAIQGGKNPMLNKLMTSSGQWGGKLKNMVEAIPKSKLTGGFKSMLRQWVDLFESVGLKAKTIKTSVGTTAKQLGRMTPTQATKALELLKTQIKNPKLVSSFGKEGNIFKNYSRLWKNSGARTTILAGVPRLFWGTNPALRSLMRNSKFYLGFLDWVGVANFVGPEELKDKMGEEKLTEKMNEYLETSDGQKRIYEDLPGAEKTSVGDVSQTVGAAAPQAPKVDINPLDSLIQSMLKPTI